MRGERRGKMYSSDGRRLVGAAVASQIVSASVEVLARGTAPARSSWPRRVKAQHDAARGLVGHVVVDHRPAPTPAPWPRPSASRRERGRGVLLAGDGVVAVELGVDPRVVGPAGAGSAVEQRQRRSWSTSSPSNVSEPSSSASRSASASSLCAARGVGADERQLVVAARLGRVEQRRAGPAPSVRRSASRLAGAEY